MTWFLSAPSTNQKKKEKKRRLFTPGQGRNLCAVCPGEKREQGGGNAPLTPHAGVHLRNTSPIYMNTCCHAMMMSEAERSGAKWPVDKFLEPGGGEQKKKTTDTFFMDSAALQQRDVTWAAFF